MLKSRIQLSRKNGAEMASTPLLESDEIFREKWLRKYEQARRRRSDLLNGLTRRQRHFIVEKLLGFCDKDAALLAGYSLSVAENTKQRLWKEPVRAQFERLRANLSTQLRSQLLI